MDAKNETRRDEGIEIFTWEDEVLAYVLRRELSPAETTFVTPPELSFQAGFVVYPAGGEVARHTHRPLHRELEGTSEVIVVREGRCEIDIYTPDEELLESRELRTGDVVLLLGGGHGFRMQEDTVLFEVKQGPYTGLDEKRRF